MALGIGGACRSRMVRWKVVDERRELGRGGTRMGVPLFGYVVVQVALLVTAVVVGGDASQALNMVTATLGTAAFSFGVLRRRPEPPRAWRVILASNWLMFGSAVAVTVSYGFDRDAVVTAPAAVGLSGLSFLVLIVGLALLWRPAPGRGAADLLDSIMIALAAFLLLWIFVIEPRLSSEPSTVATAVLFPIGCLLMVTFMARLVLGGALRDPAVRILFVGVAALLGTFVVLLVPALATAAVQNGRIPGTLACVYYAVFGAVGLHPRLAERTYRRRGNPRDLSPRRLTLFAGLALVPPLCWTVELLRYDTYRSFVITVVVPVVVSAVFLLFVVARLVLITRVAQQRAGQLVRRTAALTAAVAEQEELQRQLIYRGLHDPLTGLANRFVLAERMDEALARPTGTDRLALLLLDLDGFKDVNDTLGHPVGDEILIEVARRLLGAVPAGATLVRLGGDEFAVLLEDVTADQAGLVAESLLEVVRQGYASAGREVFLTTSIGLCVSDPRVNFRSPEQALRAIRSPEEALRAIRSPEEALRDADLALYAAKSAGKNRVMVFEPALRMAHLDRSRIRSGLRRALAEHELLLHYQPVIDLDTNAIVGVEALMRWRAPDGVIIPPADFIPIAEESGLIVAMGQWALRQACHDVKRWYAEHDVAVAVNVSGRQLEDPEFVDFVFDTLMVHGLPGAALIIEITETSLVMPSQKALYGQLQRLRDFGIRVAIDDFGTGYSSLSYVVGLPVDVVKIDRAFTQGQGHTGVLAQDWAFTGAILQLVESLHLLAVAEGVETEEQAAALRILNCPFAQGYHFARPGPASSIDATLAAPTPVRVPEG